MIIVYTVPRMEIFYEAGEAKLSANEKRKRTREDTCREIYVGHKKRVPLGELVEQFPHYMKDIDLLSSVRHTKRCVAPKVLYIYGETGIGKSYNTEEALKENGATFYFKLSGSRWWPLYDQQAVVVLEEFSSCFTCSQFLQLCDRAPFHVEYKGGHCQFNSPFIIIISNMSPGEQYAGVKRDKLCQWDAYMRRVSNSIDMSLLSYADIKRYVLSFLLE